MSFLSQSEKLLACGKDDNSKLSLLKSFLENNQSKKLQCYEITLILKYFESDSYRIDVLEIIGKHVNYVTENALLNIRRTFSTVVYDMEIIGILATKLDADDACDIIGRFKKNIYRDEFKQMYMINGIEFHENINIKIHGKEISVEIIEETIIIMHDMYHYKYKYENQMEIMINKTEPVIHVEYYKDDKITESEYYKIENLINSYIITSNDGRKKAR